MELKWKRGNGKIKYPGILVTVNKHKIHIYKQGKGKDITVFSQSVNTMDYCG